MSSRLNRTTLATAIALIVATNPVFAYSNDYDRDGLSNDEEFWGDTDRFDPDTDGGGANDGWELANGFDPTDPSDDHLIPIDLDSDNDGIADRDEGDNVFDLDSDGDGIPDAIEAGFVDADRDGFLDDLSDTNNNGMPDVAESVAVSGEYPDEDNDGVPDYLDIDADNDGITDYYEHTFNLIPTDFTIDLNDVDGDGLLNRVDPDSDGDGKLDMYEFHLTGYNQYTYRDSDGDGVPNHFDADDNAPYRPLDPELDLASNDMDRDGLSNSDEAIIGTDPHRTDSDGGGVLDGWEVENGFDPLDPSDDTGIPPDYDIDNDGVLNEHEGSIAKDADSDGDGLSDANEIGLVDADNDGFLDDLSDLNGNGLPDIAEALAISSANPYPDFDGDGLPNHLDADSDNDGVHDKLEHDISWVPDGYIGNPLDIDGDGKLNAFDLDSDGDGVLDFDEQQIWRYEKYDNETHATAEVSATPLGEVSQLADDDGDGLPNGVDIDNNSAHIDSDGDGIFNQADVDHAVYYVPNYNTWEDGWQLDANGNPLHRANIDKDSDGIDDRYDLDVGNDGALDTTANIIFTHTADNDGIPAIFDADDNAQYVAPVVETVEPEETPTIETPVELSEETTTEQVVENSPEETLDLVEPEIMVTPEVIPEVSTEVVPVTDETQSTQEIETPNAAPNTGAASPVNAAGGGAFSLWALLALCFARMRRSSGFPGHLAGLFR